MTQEIKHTQTDQDKQIFKDLKDLKKKIKSGNDSKKENNGLTKNDGQILQEIKNKLRQEKVLYKAEPFGGRDEGDQIIHLTKDNLKGFLLSLQKSDEEMHVDWMRDIGYDLSLVTFGFTALCLILFIAKLPKQANGELLHKTFITIIIIISAVVLTIAGYNEKQIAPVIGLLGTIVGYILGKSDFTKSSPKTPQPPADQSIEPPADQSVEPPADQSVEPPAS